jgi:hypothetical protein
MLFLFSLADYWANESYHAAFDGEKKIAHCTHVPWATFFMAR